MPIQTETSVGHTPGPWVLDDHTVFGGPDEQSIAELCNRSGSSMTANGRLIAAAPELLATLKDVIAHLRSITLDPGDGEDDAPALTAAEALVAKAEGRS